MLPADGILHDLHLTSGEITIINVFIMADILFPRNYNPKANYAYNGFWNNLSKDIHLYLSGGSFAGLTRAANSEFD